MVSALISRIVILVFGTLYPAYASYKAVKTKNVKEYVKWMMYWIVFAFFSAVETFADLFVSWIPFYYELKILFVLWLLSPATKGASILYRKFIHPQLAKREKEIDTYLAKASDQGYSALLTLGSRGFNYATNVVLTTAIKGQSKIADHLKKSYSLSDLDSEDGNRRYIADMEDEDFDDETDNRLIEERYEREMAEKLNDGDDGKARKRRSLVQEPDLESVEESEEQDRKAGSTKKPAYSHKEAYHYGTLPRTRGRSRGSVKKTFDEQ